jgi:hypothetical protein
VTQEVVYTTVKPDGSRSTITSFTVVAAGEMASTPVGGEAPTESPSLQDAASSLRVSVVGMGLVGLVGLVAVL